MPRVKCRGSRSRRQRGTFLRFLRIGGGGSGGEEVSGIEETGPVLTSESQVRGAGSLHGVIFVALSPPPADIVICSRCAELTLTQLDLVLLLDR